LWPCLDKSPLKAEITLQFPLCLETAVLVFAEGALLTVYSSAAGGEARRAS
jgi:hypothetical protein